MQLVSNWLASAILDLVVQRADSDLLVSVIALDMDIASMDCAIATLDSLVMIA